MKRKGYGLGKGSGYYNLMPMDSHIHSLSARGIKSYTKSEQTRLKNLLHSQRNAIIQKSAMKQPHKDIVQVLEEVDDARRTIEFGLGAKAKKEKISLCPYCGGERELGGDNTAVCYFCGKSTKLSGKGKKYGVFDLQTNQYLESGKNKSLNQATEEVWSFWSGGSDLTEKELKDMDKWSLKKKRKWLEGQGFRFDKLDEFFEDDEIDYDEVFPSPTAGMKLNAKRKYLLTDIEYDTDGRKVKLPKEIVVDIPDDVEDDEIQEYLSDEISNRTGYLHKGFSSSKLNAKGKKVTDWTTGRKGKIRNEGYSWTDVEWEDGQVEKDVPKWKLKAKSTTSLVVRPAENVTYHKGMWQTVFDEKHPKPMTNSEKQKLMKESTMLKKKIKNLLYDVKSYNGEKAQDHELLTITVLKDKFRHFNFLTNHTDWDATGYFKDKILDIKFDKENNVIMQVEFLDTKNEKIGKELVKSFNRLNNIEIGESLLYMRTQALEESSLPLVKGRRKNEEEKEMI